MRRIRSALGGIVVAVMVVAAPMGLAASAASAAPTTTPFQVPRVWASGLFTFCYPACADYPYVVTGEAPGVATFHPPPQPFGPETYWVHWTNLATGASGAAPIPNTGQAVVQTGVGVVTASMTTGTEYFGANSIFYVP